jgi:hypothetical protein
MSSLQTRQTRRGFDIPWSMIIQATTLVKAAEEEGVSFYDDNIGSICLNCVTEYLQVHWPMHEPHPTTYGMWVAVTKIALAIANIKFKDDAEGMGSSSGH